jgi:hypothetical protein
MLVNFTLTGKTPLLFHSDDVEASDALSIWRKARDNKEVSRPGDDRTPAWTWITYLYTDGTQIACPADNLSASLRAAGAEIKIKGNKTYKSLSQSGIVIADLMMPVLIGGKPVLNSKLADLETINDFEFHKQRAVELGFTLFVKRAKVGQSKHVRVRARFEEWSISGQLKVTTPNLPFDVIVEMFEIAGQYKGLMDWRPSSPKTPGPFGCFDAKVKKAA